MPDNMCCIYVFVAVLNHLAKCYMDMEMFTEAEGLYQRNLSLLVDKPGENKQEIATG